MVLPSMSTYKDVNTQTHVGLCNVMLFILKVDNFFGYSSPFFRSVDFLGMVSFSNVKFKSVLLNIMYLANVC